MSVKAKFHYASWFGASSELASVMEFGFNTTFVCCCVKVADAEVRIVRASNYVRVVEEALRKSPGGNVE